MSSPTPRLIGISFVITGASSGAGRAIALELAKEGANLTLAARRGDVLAELADECEALGAVAQWIVTDVTIPAEVEALVQRSVERFGDLDVWVNNAGVLAVGAFDETPLPVSEGVIRTNLLGYLYGAHAAITHFKKSGAGILINNISVGGYYPVPYGAAYSASKFALRGFGESLVAELTDWPLIHVCNLYPGFLDTPGMQHAANYTGKAIRPVPPVYDPQRVGLAVVDLALQPQPTYTIGATTHLLRWAHSLAPRLSTRATAAVVRKYLASAPELPPHAGNVLSPVEYGATAYGGWNSSADRERRRELLNQGLALVGLVAGIWLFRKRWRIT